MNTFFSLRTFLLLLPTVFLGSCQKESSFDCLKSTGKITTETRDLAPFQTLRVFDNLNVKIVADPAYFGEIKTGENLQANIITEVKNGELWIQNINKCNWVRSYNKPFEVTIHTPSIRDIFHEGFGTISSHEPLPADTLFLHLNSAGNYDLTLQTQHIWLDMYETGDMKLRGTNQHLQAYNYSMGRLFADALQTRNANVLLTHLGHAYVQVSENLSATIENKGNVYYKNQPANLSRQGQGSGQLIQIK